MRSWGGRLRAERDIVVVDVLVPGDKEARVLGIKDGAADVVAGEVADRVLGIPQGEEEEFRPVALDAPERENAAIPRRRSVRGQAGGVQIVQVRIGVGGSGGPGPGASDHAPSARVDRGPWNLHRYEPPYRCRVRVGSAPVKSRIL